MIVKGFSGMPGFTPILHHKIQMGKHDINRTGRDSYHHKFSHTQNGMKEMK